MTFNVTLNAMSNTELAELVNALMNNFEAIDDSLRPTSEELTLEDAINDIMNVDDYDEFDANELTNQLASLAVNASFKIKEFLITRID